MSEQREQLVEDLENANLHGLAQRAANGEFSSVSGQERLVVLLFDAEHLGPENGGAGVDDVVMILERMVRKQYRDW